jgi:hypothetical protein
VSSWESKRFGFQVEICKAAESGQLAKLAQHYDLPKRAGGWCAPLLALSTRANADGTNAYPSSEWLGKVTGRRADTVADVLGDAVRMGLIKTDGKHRRATVYNLLDVSAALAVLDAPQAQPAPQPAPQPQPQPAPAWQGWQAQPMQRMPQPGFESSAA